MSIKSISIGGFKNIQKTQIEFNGIVALLSPNNYGKSNFLEAIDFGLDFIGASLKERRGMMRFSKGFPLTPSLQNDDFYFQIEIVAPELKNYCFVKYGFSFRWYKDNKSGAYITDEWLEARASESVRYTSYIKRKDLRFRKSKEIPTYKSLPVDSQQLMIDVLPIIEGAEISIIADYIRRLDYRICSSLDLNDRFQSLPFEYYDEDNDQSIAFDDEDTPRAIYHLKENYPEKYQLFEEAVFSLFPEFTSLLLSATDTSSFSLQQLRSYKISQNNDETKTEESLLDAPPARIKEELYYLFIASKTLNQPMNIQNMSAGTKRVLWLLANIFIASCTKISLIGIEEVETSIHPKMLKTLLEILSEATEQSSMVISSHSPYLVQYLKISNLYLGVPSEDGAACFRRFRKSKIKNIIEVSRDLDMNVGEYIFDLLSSGNRGTAILNQFLEEV